MNASHAIAGPIGMNQQFAMAAKAIRGFVTAALLAAMFFPVALSLVGDGAHFLMMA